MKKLILASLVAFIGIGGAQATTTVDTTYGIKNEVIAHGGGCRKSSPPGQCCHKDHKTGLVHCH